MYAKHKGAVMRMLPIEMAKQQLESMIGAKLLTIDPDAIDAAVGSTHWLSLPADIKDKGDAAMVEMLGLSLLAPDTELIVVTDASYGDGESGGAFVVNASSFSELESFHHQNFAERVFSGGDVIIWSPSVGMLWIVHHEGIFTTLQLEKS